MRAKLIKVEPNKTWYFTSYYYECIDCGKTYSRHQCNSRISPYCSECQLKHDKEREKERKAKRKKYFKMEILNLFCDSCPWNDRCEEGCTHRINFEKGLGGEHETDN